MHQKSEVRRCAFGYLGILRRGFGRPKAEAVFRGKLEDSKVYRPPYLWGQCVAWFKQTVFDPTASLSADRRGTLSLPDVETLYKGVSNGTLLLSVPGE